MSLENKPVDSEAPADHGSPLEKPFMLNERTRQMILESEKEYRRHKRREKRIEFSWASWFFDPFPSDEMYRPPLQERRNTRQEMAYHRLRQVTSWAYWSRVKSSSGLKLAAVGGLVAAFLQAAPLLRGGDMAVGPLSWLLMGGGFYLLAVI